MSDLRPGTTARADRCQRWRPGGRAAWARAGRFDPARYAVAPLPEAEAKAFVTAMHYSRSYPAAILRYGLHDLHAGGALAGVAVLSLPMAKVLTAVFPALEPCAESLELGRFVLAHHVPANGESWMLAEVRRQAAAQGIRGLVSFSDPVPRRTTAGQVTMPGHVGFIYQASNAAYLGRSTPRTLILLPDGTTLNARAAQKIRTGERGWRYAADRLATFPGARPPAPGQAGAGWLAETLNAIGATRIRHPGCHRYAFTLGITRTARAAVTMAGDPGRYPKPDWEADDEGGMSEYRHASSPEEPC